jgi:hypothetical protein
MKTNYGENIDLNKAHINVENVVKFKNEHLFEL